MAKGEGRRPQDLPRYTSAPQFSYIKIPKKFEGWPHHFLDLTGQGDEASIKLPPLVMHFKSYTIID
jgi:hypothetical protein